ncbi:uncharacterized protein TNCV_2122981 [Trichonephila clavipes]|nr:uncharacterized protein TNCV_2122981 [Trichonephila clavipes]
MKSGLCEGRVRTVVMGAQRVINPDNIGDGSFELKRDKGVANPEGLICENSCEEKYTLGTLMGCEKQLTVDQESFRNHTMAKIAGQSNRTLPVVWLGRVNRYPYPRIKCIKYGNLNQGFVKGILETGGVMDKCVQMWTRNYGALGQTARVCFGVGQVCPDVDKELLRLGRPGRKESREKRKKESGRENGRKEEERRKRERGDRKRVGESDARLEWKKGLSPEIGEKKDDERRWR